MMHERLLALYIVMRWADDLPRQAREQLRTDLVKEAKDRLVYTTTEGRRLANNMNDVLWLKLAGWID